MFGTFATFPFYAKDHANSPDSKLLRVPMFLQLKYYNHFVYSQFHVNTWCAYVQFCEITQDYYFDHFCETSSDFEYAL